MFSNRINLTGAISVIVFLFSLAACSDVQTGYQDLGTASGCDAAASSCRVSAEGVVVTLSLGPDVTPLKPFPMTVLIEGGRVESSTVVADFQMKGMDMGINRYRLKQDGNDWVTNVTLPVCTASRMDWFTRLEFMLDGERYAANFPFHIEAN